MEAVLAGCFLDELPEKLIGDKAYDSDALDQTLAEEYGIEMIAPNRGNRAKRRMAAHCVVISADGKWNGCLHGCKTSVAWSLDGSSMSKTSLASSSLPVS